MSRDIKRLCEEYDKNKGNFKTKITVEDVLQVVDIAIERLEKKGLTGTYYTDAVIIALKVGYMLGRNEFMKKSDPR